MSFQSVEDGGIWKPGGTYTFELDTRKYYSYISENGDWTEAGTGYTLAYEGAFYESYSWSAGGYWNIFDMITIAPDVGDIVLCGNKTTFSSSESPGTEITGGFSAEMPITQVEDLGSGVYRYTVEIPSDFPEGTYYLKAAPYSFSLRTGIS